MNAIRQLRVEYSCLPFLLTITQTLANCLALFPSAYQCPMVKQTPHMDINILNREGQYLYISTMCVVCAVHTAIGR